MIINLALSNTEIQRKIYTIIEQRHITINDILEVMRGEKSDPDIINKISEEELLKS